MMSRVLSAAVACLISVSLPLTTAHAEAAQVGAYAERKVVVEAVRREDLERVTQKYATPGTKVVPVVLDKSELSEETLSKLTDGGKIDEVLAQQYAAREADAEGLNEFKGGEVVVVLSAGTVLLVILILLLID